MPNMWICVIGVYPGSRVCAGFLLAGVRAGLSLPPPSSSLTLCSAGWGGAGVWSILCRNMWTFVCLGLENACVGRTRGKVLMLIVFFYSPSWAVIVFTRLRSKCCVLQVSGCAHKSHLGVSSDLCRQKCKSIWIKVYSWRALTWCCSFPTRGECAAGVLCANHHWIQKVVVLESGFRLQGEAVLA